MFKNMVKAKKGFSLKSILHIIFLVILIVVIVLFIFKNFNNENNNAVSSSDFPKSMQPANSLTEIENSNRQDSSDSTISNPATENSENSVSLETLNPNVVNPETIVLTEADLPLDSLSDDEQAQFVETYGKCCADEALSESVGSAWQAQCTNQYPSFACELFTVGDSETGISFSPCVWKVGECFYKN